MAKQSKKQAKKAKPAQKKENKKVSKQKTTATKKKIAVMPKAVPKIKPKQKAAKATKPTIKEKQEKPMQKKKPEPEQKQEPAKQELKKPEKQKKAKPEQEEEVVIDKASLPKLRRPLVVHPGDSWKKVEAVLFASGKYLPDTKIAELAGIPLNETKAALMQLQEKYTSEDTTLQLFNEGNTWKLNVREEYTQVVKNIVSEAELPPAVLETLAIIAFKTPVLQSDVINSRGTGAYDHIALLEQKGFVTREKHSRTFKLKVAEKFFDYFDVAGEAKIQELFKDAKRPDTEDLAKFQQQTPEEERTKFDEKIIERMKKLEETSKQKEDKTEFLKDFEKRIQDARDRISTTEGEIGEYRRKLEQQQPEQDIIQEQKTTQEPEVQQKLDEKKEFLKRIDEDPDEEGDND